MPHEEVHEYIAQITKWGKGIFTKESLGMVIVLDLNEEVLVRGEIPFMSALIK